MSRPVILILGPTAGGKTDLSMALAGGLPGGGEIIGCDSMQIYRGMDIGTAKPTLAQRATVPHHLIDVADPGDASFSVDRWLTLAHAAIGDIRERGRWPIVVGGTNLYVQALLYGLADGPAPDLDFRQELSSWTESALREKLITVDRVAAERIHPNDRKRTVRALEVFHATGKPLSERQTQWSQSPDHDGQDAGGMSAESLIVGLNWPTEEINRLINSRVKEMMSRGFLDEVRRLEAKKQLGRNAREALGYKQIIDHLAGRFSLEEAVEQIKIRTRQYAKQQRSWLRRFMHSGIPSIWHEPAQYDAQTLVYKALTWIIEKNSADNAQLP